MLAVAATQILGEHPGLAGPAQVAFLAASAAVALGFGADLAACVFLLVRRLWRGAGR